MTAQLTKKWDGFSLAVADDDRVGDRKHEFSIRGEGKTKHEAIASALAAVKQARAALDRAEQEIHAI